MTNAANRVFLVGAGPGDPELLTLKAVRLLQSANVVLHDALVSPAVLELVSPSAQIINIGKRCGQKLLTQEEINSLLVHHGARAKITVRLKGGDPSIFGRSGEEIQALQDAGIAYEIVPGITSALAAAAVAGISLTDRRFASSVVFATAHLRPGKDAVDWQRLVASNSTLVIYMPGGDYQRLSDDLRGTGLAAETPCTVVSSAGLPAQKVLWSTLEQIGRSAALPAPSLVIVGSCAGALTALQELQVQPQHAGHTIKSTDTAYE
jgi:uroporphyrin-III C-methyltransferase